MWLVQALIYYCYQLRGDEAEIRTGFWGMLNCMVIRGCLYLRLDKP